MTRLLRLCAVLGFFCGLLLACSGESPEAPRELRQSATLEVALWTPLALPTAATSRAFHGAVYEPSLESILLFGGRDGDDAGASLDDSGLASGASWLALSSAFAPRGYVRGAFDGPRSRVVTYGGLNVGLISGVTHYAETWEFNASDSKWALRTSLSLPGRRSGYGLAYDTRRKVTVLFGGFDDSWKDDLYEWNGTSWTKACATAACLAAPRPSARSLPLFVYDEARGVSLLFGGNGPKGLVGDTWSWDGVRWTLLKPAVAPAPRDSGAATYDPISKRVLLFGGAFSDAREAGDFWAWNGAEWSRIAQTTTPVNRRGGALVLDAKRRRGVLLGGTSGGRVTDAWTFVLSGTPCQVTAECHVGVCLNGTCSAPPDDGGAGGAGGDASDSGGTGGSSGNGGGGAATAGSAPNPSGGQTGGGVTSSGGAPAAMGGEPPTLPHVGGLGSSGAGAAGERPVAGTTQTLESGDPEATRRRSFYACGVGHARLDRWPYGALSMVASLLLVASARRASSRRARSGPAAPTG